MISSHIRDAVALAEFFSHLEQDIKTGDANYTELSAAELVRDHPKFIYGQSKGRRYYRMPSNSPFS